MHFVEQKGFFISVERSDFVEEIVLHFAEQKGFCILVKRMILLKNLVCILLNKKCVFAFELNKEVYVSIFLVL